MMEKVPVSTEPFFREGCWRVGGDFSAESSRMDERRKHTGNGIAEGGAHEYRAKAFEYLSLAENMNDPERRADLLRFAKIWMTLAEPMGDVPGAYELPRQH